MKHPSREEWAPFVFGEALPETATRLKAHLESCPDCASELEGWRRTVRRLDAWALPEIETPRSAALFNAPLPWAAAAAVILLTGIGIGRWTAPASAPGISSGELRAQINSSVVAALAASRIETSNAVAEAEQRFWRVTEDGMDQLAEEFAGALSSTRTEDRLVWRTMLDEIEKQRATDYVSLRKDLETVASMTDEEIRQARRRMVELAASVRPPSEP